MVFRFGRRRQSATGIICFYVISAIREEQMAQLSSALEVWGFGAMKFEGISKLQLIIYKLYILFAVPKIKNKVYNVSR